YKAYLEDQKFVEKAKNAIKATVTEVSDSEIQDFYDRTLESQGNTFGQYPEQYEQAMIYGDYITYNVEGYRRIKQILIGYTDEDKGKLDEQIGNEEGYQAALQTAQENIRAEAEDVLSQVKSGADFDGLITTYNDDPGISSFPDGYYVSADSAIWDPVFITAAMALAKVGDTSELVATNYGYHILKYASDVTPGAIPLNQIDKEKSREATLADKKEEFLKAEVERWESIAKIERFYDKL
ncbi:MAG: peptidylprolyl isomerase, partial [Bacillota bacterium]|nr:peptidylprolyl isomerase [Bacillota bacterium]